MALPAEMTQPKIMKPTRDVGIVGYGAYVPRYRLPAAEVARVWKEGTGGTPIKEKAVPGKDEDTATMAVEAARNAVKRSKISASELRAVWVGSESHPYAVKPTSTIVAEAIGAVPSTMGADWQFACKAGTEAFQASMGFVGSGMADYAMAIGMDTAQGKPGDALEYTAGAGGAAFLVGPAENSLAVIEGSYSFVTDTPDFWRRANKPYPEHGQRFTGEPAYFRHVMGATESLMEALGTQPSDYAHVVFHQPNAKFPMRVGKMLGFAPTQIETGLLVPTIGNTYAGAALIGLSAILDVAKPGDLILMTSFGSGAGSDSFQFRVTDNIETRQKLAPTTQQYIKRRTEIDYSTYTRLRGKLVMK